METKKPIYSAKTDPQFSSPALDTREVRTRQLENGEEIPYHYCHGSFAGTNLKFSFCFPMQERYEGRFFQHLSPFPGPDEELAALGKRGEDDFIAFALTHGGAYVESNMASSAIFGSNADPTIIYRSSAATAEYCRTVAQELYGPHRVYGYVFGGSGGGYKTMSCIENTDAFDGAVPFVIGSPVSLPNCLTVWAYGGRMLRHCWERIVDALEPGGSGDPCAGLTEEERGALREVTLMGVPPRMSYIYGNMDDGSLPVLMPGVKGFDPTYFSDFWTKPGYAGTETGGSAQRDRVLLHTRVTGAGFTRPETLSDGTDGRNGTDDAWQKMLTDGSAAWIEVEDVPAGEDPFLRGVDIRFESGEAKGKCLRLGSIEGKRLIPGQSYGTDDPAEVIGSLRPGDEVTLDNSDYIAIQYFHRHQVPADPSFHAFDQYREQNLPQRAQVISYGFTAGGCGSVQDGQVQGKVIILNNLMDADFPWQADWYRRKIEEVKGADAPDWVRLYYNDNAPHGDVSETGEELRMVSYLGMLRQALVDLAAWVERDVPPAKSSGYELRDNQVFLAPDARTRRGIQPLVTLLAEGAPCAHVTVGQTVHFRAEIRMSAGAGGFEAAEWSFEGEQDYPGRGGAAREQEEDGIRCASVEAEHVYETPGTYFAVVRVSSNRNPGDSFTRLRNLCRARVIVEPEK